jgi:hypothetical protein
MEFKSGILTLVYPHGGNQEEQQHLQRHPRSALVWPHEQAFMYFPDGLYVELEMLFDAANVDDVKPWKVVNMLRKSIRYKLEALRSTEAVIRYEIDLFVVERTTEKGDVYTTLVDDAWIQLIEQGKPHVVEMAAQKKTCMRQVVTIGISHHHVLTALKILLLQHQELPFDVFKGKDAKVQVAIKPVDPAWLNGRGGLDRDFFLKKALPSTQGSSILQLRSNVPTVGKTDWYVGDVLWKMVDCLLLCTPADAFFIPPVNATPIDVSRGQKRARDPGEYMEEVMDQMDEFGNTIAVPPRRSPLAPVPRVLDETVETNKKDGLLGLKPSIANKPKQPPKKKQRTGDVKIVLPKGQQTLAGFMKH